MEITDNNNEEIAIVSVEVTTKSHRHLMPELSRAVKRLGLSELLCGNLPSGEEDVPQSYDGVDFGLENVMEEHLSTQDKR